MEEQVIRQLRKSAFYQYTSVMHYNLTQSPNNVL